MYKGERDVLEMKKKGTMRHGEVWCTTVDSTEKTVAILGDGWWPQVAKQEGGKTRKKHRCTIWIQRNERPTVGGVSIRSRNSVPSRKECVAKSSND